MVNTVNQQSSLPAIATRSPSRRRTAVKSIAFPGFSTGFYGYPKEDAAKIAVREMREFLSSAENVELEGACPHAPNGRAQTQAAPEMEVIFCSFSERDKSVYEHQSEEAT